MGIGPDTDFPREPNFEKAMSTQRAKDLVRQLYRELEAGDGPEAEWEGIPSEPWSSLPHEAIAKMGDFIAPGFPRKEVCGQDDDRRAYYQACPWANRQHVARFAAKFCKDIDTALRISTFNPPATGVLHHLKALPHVVMDEEPSPPTVRLWSFCGDKYFRLRAWCGIGT